MKIAIICAMEKEITYIKEHFGGKLIDERFGVYSARVGEHEVLSTLSLC